MTLLVLASGLGGIHPGARCQDGGRLIRLRTLGVAHLENNHPELAMEPLGELVSRAPGELLGVRNLAIARLRSLEKKLSTPRQARSALEQLLSLEGETLPSLLLASRVAVATGEKEEALELLRKATGRFAGSGVVWTELYLFGKDSPDEALRREAGSALDRAYALEQGNLYLLTEWLLRAARAKNPQIREVLVSGRGSVQLLAERVRQEYGSDPLTFLDRALEAAEDNDWAGVLRGVFPLVNVLRPQPALQSDRRRVVLHTLEFVIHEFSAATAAGLPELSPTRAIPVVLRRLPDGEKLPQQNEQDRVIRVELEDFDLDGRLDVIVLCEKTIQVFTRPDGESWQRTLTSSFPEGMHGLVLADLDSDVQPTRATRSRPEKKPSNQLPDPCPTADLDLVVFGAGVQVLENRLESARGNRALLPAPGNEEIEMLRQVQAVLPVDFDQDGDLDLVVASEAGISLWSNRGNLTFLNVSTRARLPPRGFQPRVLVLVDWDRDVDLDIVMAGSGTPALGYLENYLHGLFRWRELPEHPAVSSVVLLDADANASWDLLVAGEKGIDLLPSDTARPGTVKLRQRRSVDTISRERLTLWDFDNDGAQDLLAIGAGDLSIYRGDFSGGFQAVSGLLDPPVEGVQQVAVGDLDGDGDQDLAVLAGDGVSLYSNHGGNKNHWLDVKLCALQLKLGQLSLSGRVNQHGVGSLLEINAGGMYLPRVVLGPTTHFGLGPYPSADVLRTLWTNGIPQNLLEPGSRSTICEVQSLKGSCPYLYTWVEEGYEFFTDLLWSAPLGLQFAEGVYAPARPWEYIKIPGEKLTEREGRYWLQITEELWEVAYFDRVELIAVDHPEGVEIFSNEKVGPAEIAGFKIHTVGKPRTPRAALDHHGRDVLETIRDRDGVYLKGHDRKLCQGLTEDHHLELDLGPLPDAEQITLFLTGWVYPTDTSINVALGQNPDLPGARPPSLWVPDGEGSWKVAIPYMGFPGGKTKTIAVDLSGVFPEGDHRLRIETNMEIYWDAVFFTVDETPAPLEQKEMELESANLHYRGVSRIRPDPGHGPDHYLYGEVVTTPVWPPVEGRFTRYGDVTELLVAADDRMVVLGAGDEMTLVFTPPATAPRPGWKRDFLLHSVGWDKDADLNTIYGQTVEPLPFGAMSGYPYSLGQAFPDTPVHREYLDRYQTRTQDPAAFWRQIQGRVGSPESERQHSDTRDSGARSRDTQR